jgi:hypothetical protein
VCRACTVPAFSTIGAVAGRVNRGPVADCRFVGGPDLERHSKLQEASARSWKDAISRQLTKFAGQFAIFGAGSLQRKRVLIGYAPVTAREPLHKPKVLRS